MDIKHISLITQTVESFGRSVVGYFYIGGGPDEGVYPGAIVLMHNPSPTFGPGREYEVTLAAVPYDQGPDAPAFLVSTDYDLSLEQAWDRFRDRVFLKRHMGAFA